MSSAELKEYIHKQIDGVEDERFLQAIYSMLQSYVSSGDEVIGYNTSGEPISKE